MDLRLKHPFTMVISGPTSSGKSVFTERLLKTRQLCPANPKFIQQAYIDATSRPFGYLFLDLKQKTPDEYSMPLSEEQAALLRIILNAKPELRNAMLKNADKEKV
ncbi:hypothetical protein B566_EDAN014534 [Ephemera danica]|nr:hypothetical protein B566_EDAN014534 [Ephemera danica]